MSDKALQIYEESLKEQHNRNEARRIRTRVTEARKASHRAGVRWPFELLQNALDAGPRSGRSHVNVTIRCDASRIVFEHDGAPFTTTELAALLSGGSSKEFESEVTTGRFGTGFLVTHVLSERTSLQALLAVDGRCELFDVRLDRSGDEEAILANIRSCSGAIAAAAPIAGIDAMPSATFEYQITDAKILRLGLDSLKQALPYLYATRPTLGRLVLIENEIDELWSPDEVAVGAPCDGGVLQTRSIAVTRGGDSTERLKIRRFSSSSEGSAALVLLKEATDGWKVVPPAKDAPRIYREYPVRDSAFLPVAFVLDGKFEPDQERGRVLMDDHDKTLLQEALSACVLAISEAVKQRWTGAHLLAAVTSSSIGFDPNDPEELDWWNSELRQLADRMARLPIVDCGNQWLPALSDDGPFADFVVPRLSSSSSAGETTMDRAWDLMDASTGLYPPRRDLAGDWSSIALGWRELGVNVNLVALSDMPRYVADDVQEVSSLLVTGEPIEWIAKWLDAIGECLDDSTAADLSALEGMIPNQNLELCAPEQLRRDAGIPTQLKELSAELGRDVKGRLFSEDVSDKGRALELIHLERAIEVAIPAMLSEIDVVEELLDYINESLPEDDSPSPDDAYIIAATVKLAAFLWSAHGIAATSTARRLPLLSSDGVSVRWTPHRMMMAPLSAWVASARQFAVAYPPSRVLAELYTGTKDGSTPDVVAPLISWGIAYSDPIATDVPVELKGRRLDSISGDPTDGVTVSGEVLSQIALLQPEVLNRCQEGQEEAKALLGLVLCHVAPNELSWENERVVTGRRGGENVNVTIWPALWLADLKFRSWVPAVDETGETTKMPATAATLRGLIDPSWLQHNDPAVRLLSRWFDFDELDLRLLGSAPELRNGLAKLVESAGADPDVYAALAEELQARQRRKRDVARFRAVGLAVQEAIRVALESRGLLLTLVDRGFDYEVDFPREVALDELALSIQVGPYLLEVKATTSGAVRMTPLQAQTAARESARYVLCVVDLRTVSESALDEHWTAAAVEPLAKLMSDIGESVEQTWSLIEEARRSDVGIRNDGVLRYEVPQTVWRSGVGIAQWITNVYDNLAKSTGG